MLCIIPLFSVVFVLAAVAVLHWLFQHPGARISRFPAQNATGESLSLMFRAYTIAETPWKASTLF